MSESFTLAIKSNGHRGPAGFGAKFTGTCLATGRVVQCVADMDFFPADSRIPLAGDVWRVKGKFRKKYPDRPALLYVSACALENHEGDYLAHYLSCNEAFAGTYVGAGKIGNIVDHYKAKYPYGPDDGDDAKSRWWRELVKALDASHPAPFVTQGLLSEKSARRLLEAWREAERNTTRVAVYLQEKGFDRALGNRIISYWGDEAVATLEENPYYMLSFVPVFADVDRVARSMYGLADDDPRRSIAAVQAHLYARLLEGHTLTRHNDLVLNVSRLLGAGTATAEEAVRVACALGPVEGGPDFGYQTMGAAWLEQHVRESLLAIRDKDGISQRERQHIALDPRVIDGLIARYEEEQRRKPGKETFALKRQQIEALHMALAHPLSVLCGGAGVGKTTVLDCLLYILKATGQDFHQMALAGRAAKRMRDATNEEARTIALFLVHLEKGGISLGHYPLIIIDESSMLDLPTLDRILRALPPMAKVRFLFVGDPYQLPPIQFGLVFHKLAASDAIPRVELTELLRHSSETGIPRVVTDIRNGRVPHYLKDKKFKYRGKADGVSFCECRADQINAKMREILIELGDVDGQSVQGLAVRNIGNGGVDRINAWMQNEMDRRWRDQGLGERPTHHVTDWDDLRFSFADPVMWTENDYDKGIFNGTLGVVIEANDECVVVDFEGTEVALRRDEIGHLALAYSITVHKAQGSEFERVVIPIVRSVLLDVSMIYTAATRASKQVVFLGNFKAFEYAITHPSVAERREVGLMFA